CVVLQCRDETHAGRDAAGQIRALALAVVLVGLQSFGIDHGLARDWIALLAQVLHQRIGLGSLVRSVPEMLDRAGDAVGGVTDSLEQVIAPAITGWTNCEWHCVSPPLSLCNQAKFPCAAQSVPCCAPVRRPVSGRARSCASRAGLRTRCRRGCNPGSTTCRDSLPFPTSHFRLPTCDTAAYRMAPGSLRCNPTRPHQSNALRGTPRPRRRASLARDLL